MQATSSWDPVPPEQPIAHAAAHDPRALALRAEALAELEHVPRDVGEADDIFVKLMGDVVEPRREFIQDNSLSANVDV